MKQKKPFEGPRFKVKIIPDELEKFKQGKLYLDSLEDFWDPIEKFVYQPDESEILEMLEQANRMWDLNYIKSMPPLPSYTFDDKAYLAARDYRGESIMPLYPEYNCRIPIKWFQRVKLNETEVRYRANTVESGHITNKSALIRSSLECQIDGITGTYSFVENALSEQDILDFFTVNFFHFKNLISSETDYDEKMVYKLACMYTAARYVAVVQGYLSNSAPSHWVIVEEVEGEIAQETIREINSMKLDMHKLIIATTAQWWVSDFSVGAEEKFPALLKKMLLELETLKPIFKNFIGAENQMQKLIHKAIHFVDRRNVLKAINMENPAWTGVTPVGLPMLKKVEISKLASSEILDLLKRVPAGYTSYGNCYKVIEIMEAYKLSKFIYYRKEAELLKRVMEEIRERPNHYHINSHYLNESDERFVKPKRYYKSDIREIVLECAIFLLFTQCHKGLLKSPIFYPFMPVNFEGIVKICPGWLALLFDYVRDKTLIEEAKLWRVEERKDGPFAESIRADLMRQFAANFKIRSGYIYQRINGVFYMAGSIDP